MGELLKRGITHSRHTPRKGLSVSPEARGIVVPGLLVPSKLSALAPFAQEFADASGAETYLLNDNGRGRTIKERAKRIADKLATDPRTRDAEDLYLVGQSRGGTSLASLELELREMGYHVAGLGYVTPRGVVDETPASELAKAFGYDLATTAFRTLLHPVDRRRRILPQTLFLANSVSGLVVKTALGEIGTEIDECTRKNPDNREVTSRVVVLYAANDKIADYRKLLAKGESHEDIEKTCETILRQEFPNAENVGVIIVPDEQHDLPISRPRKTARLVYSAMTRQP